MTKMQSWLACCGIMGLLATLQMSSVTGDVATQLVMFPIYALFYGSVLFGIIQGVKALSAGKGEKRSPSSGLVPPFDLPTPSSARSGTAEAADERPLDFNDAELEVYGRRQLNSLYEILNRRDDEIDAATCNAICRKIGRQPFRGSPRDFLIPYYRQLHAKLSEKFG